MVIGNVLALPQRNLKRMLAYSSIAHAGYLLLGVIAAGRQPEGNGGSSVLFYLAAYTFMNLGAFGLLVLVRNRRPFGYTLDEIAGLWRSMPWPASSWRCSIVAHRHPPTVGFWGKFCLFTAVIRRTSRGSPSSPSSWRGVGVLLPARRLVHVLPVRRRGARRGRRRTELAGRRVWAVTLARWASCSWACSPARSSTPGRLQLLVLLTQGGCRPRPTRATALMRPAAGPARLLVSGLRSGSTGRERRAARPATCAGRSAARSAPSQLEPGCRGTGASSASRDDRGRRQEQSQALAVSRRLAHEVRAGRFIHLGLSIPRRRPFSPCRPEHGVG
jgi:hypothetical protein